MINKKLELAIELVQLGKNLSDEEICNKVIEEFHMDCTQHDLNVIRASRLPDNFDVESRKIEYYGRAISFI